MIYYIIQHWTDHVISSEDLTELNTWVNDMVPPWSRSGCSVHAYSKDWDADDTEFLGTYSFIIDKFVED